ncbi:sigma factor [Brevibacillus formosus]|uniref:sigma factor n=1 Tax=Brevibacillus formosus TaxID=54913 RepID=UPI001F1CE3CB|nr:sigma factor [Brevibacillus formosus]
MKEENIKPWLIRMRQGEEEAFQEVYQATRTYAYNLIYFLAPHKQEVDDMLSEVYVELIRSIDRYDVEQPFIPWFNGLIVRQVRNWNRRIWRNTAGIGKRREQTGNRRNGPRLFRSACKREAPSLSTKPHDRHRKAGCRKRLESMDCRPQ